MTGGSQSFTIEELSDRTDISVRTIRFYIAEGLVPRPVARGKGASYGDEHLDRLLLIRRLSEQRVPLAEIRERLAGLSLSEIRALLRAEDEHSAELRMAEQAPSSKEYVSALLRRSREARSSSARRTEAAEADLAGPLQLAEDAEPNTRRGNAEGTAPSRDAALLPPANKADLPWRRLELAPGVELHVRADAESRFRQLIERLLNLARRG